MVEFDETVWLEKLDQVQTTEALTALILEIPLDPSDSINPADPASSITEAEIALPPSTLPTPTGRTTAG